MILLIVSCLQVRAIIVDPFVRLPKDSLQRLVLVRSLDSFLVWGTNQASSDKYLFAEERLETLVLLEEMKDIEKSGKYRNEKFYKPYLNSVRLLPDSSYLLRVSYLGIAGDTALLRAGFDILAHYNGSGFSFSSPLKYRTAKWQTVSTADAIFHFKDSIDRNSLDRYVQTIKKFDRKLGRQHQILEMYLGTDAVEMQHVMGLDYKLDYNGASEISFSSSHNNRQLTIAACPWGYLDFDPHDLWHSRLAKSKLVPVVNRPVDEGCAYLYGGSWGLSWQVIYRRFKEKVASNRSTDWAKIKEQPLNFSDNEAEPLMADYVVNALIIHKIEKEKGFMAATALLGCGKPEAGNANYYSALERLTGIGRDNYNKEVWKLIDSYEP